jgi:DNA-binding response OmpR family regulator
MTNPSVSEGQTPKQRLLVVDDDAALLDELKLLLQMSGYDVVTAANGRDALDLTARLHPDLIILDVRMPPPDGRQVLRHLRHEKNNWTPVILLTVVGTPAERALSLHEGADDYLNKPFDRVELLARVEAVLRRAQHSRPPLGSFRRLISGELILDRQARQVSLGGIALALTPRSLHVLEYLMLHPQEIITRERLLEQVWGWAQSIEVEARVVDNLVARLRKEIKDDARQPHYIQTVTSQGYCFIADVEGQP